MVKTVDVEIKTVRRFFTEKNFREHAQRDRRLRKVGLQAVKWTTEGAGKKKQAVSFFCILRREAYVSCRGYVGILIRAFLSE